VGDRLGERAELTTESVDPAMGARVTQQGVSVECRLFFGSNGPPGRGGRTSKSGGRLLDGELWDQVPRAAPKLDSLLAARWRGNVKGRAIGKRTFSPVFSVPCAFHVRIRFPLASKALSADLT
jgi:hypothetical protein